MSRVGWLLPVGILVGCDVHLAPPPQEDAASGRDAVCATPEGDEVLGTWDGVTFTVDEADAVLALVNDASLEELDHSVPLDSRAAANIVTGRPIDTVAELSLVSYVGPSALGALLAYAPPAQDCGPVDADGDGYAADVDCDDVDPEVHPDAPETCDGVDDDCDPLTLETGLVTGNGVSYATLADALVHTPPGGVVELCDGTYAGVLTLAQPVTIRGRGPGVTVIDGGGVGPVLTVQGVSVLEDLTITGGYANSDGGGLYVTAPTLELRRVDVVANHAGSEGGGLYARYTDLVLEDVTLTGNDANVDGGAIWLYNTHPGLAGSRVSIVGNSSRQKGGGVYLWASAFECVDCEVAANTSGRGAGLYLGGSTSRVALVDGLAIENHAAELGGGVYVGGGTFDVDGADLGVGATENLPDDVASAGFRIGRFGEDTTASCDNTGC